MFSELLHCQRDGNTIVL
ncbi:hypothetical protein Pint_03656 [Pistacia integerrima]|uniref:Uncharacterized protein n=2 Tax=Pistacia TaxID=55512 RepID=A0ACC1BQU5_9ROSI|nr:hypothetical protein Pint_03656 [Pistacia integerrima]KAJ0101319.1 hypothetical protein Patl1_03706 [Pistacia atlantica]